MKGLCFSKFMSIRNMANIFKLVRNNSVSKCKRTCTSAISHFVKADLVEVEGTKYIYM